MRSSLRGSLAGSSCLLAIALAAPAAAQDIQRINVPAQPLAAAITELGRETGWEIGGAVELVENRRSKSVSGEMTPRGALETMLAGSDLIVRQLPGQGLVIVRAAQVQSTQGSVELDEIIVNAPRGSGAPGPSGSGGAFDVFEETRTIETVDAEEIEKSNVRDVADALDSTANVVVVGQTSPTSLNVTVRGIANFGNVNSTAPSTGIFVDGVLLNQTSQGTGINPALIDAERVDIFLGPQTTTFGRATTAGAVNVVTKKPTDELEFIFQGEVGSFPDGSGSLVANLPLLEDGLLSARIVAFGSGSDGFIEFFDDAVTDELGQEVFGGRVSLRSQPTDDLTLDLQTSFTRTEFDASSLVTLALLDEEEFIAFPNPQGEDSNIDFVARFEARYDTDIGTFSSNTAFRINENTADFDGDGTPTGITETLVGLDTTTFSQEFRYDGSALEVPGVPGTVVFSAGTSFNFSDFTTSDTVTFAGDSVPLIAGGAALLAMTDPTGFAEAAAALGLPNDVGAVTAFLGGLSPAEIGFLDTDDQQEFINVSLYADLAWRPIAPLELSGGFRYSFDRVDASDRTVTLGPAVPLGFFEEGFFVEDSASFNSVSPRASISYDWTDDITTFFAFATGFRPGGIADTPTTTFEFDPETTRSFEVGIRSRFFDERLSVNAGAFFTQIDDFQAPITFVFEDTFIPPATVLANAGDATSFGADLSVTALPTDGLFMQVNAGLNFTEIDDFTFPPLGSGGDPIDLSGTDLPNAPNFTLAITGDYEHPKPLFGDVRPFIRADYNLRTDFIGSISAEPTEIDGYDTLDLRVGLRGEGFFVELFGENILDQIFATTGGPAPSSGLPIPVTALGLPEVAGTPVGVPGPPRRWGIRARFEL
ncbi:MAG: TonB-dependent receptor [Pseudomonadota bacterium]